MLPRPGSLPFVLERGHFLPFDHREFLISGLMPAREINLIAGASGAGKSRFGIQLGGAVQAGEPFFGRATSPTKVLFVCCDRGEDSFKRSLDAYHLPYDTFKWVTESDIPFGLRKSRPFQILDWASTKHPENRLVILDGFSGLVKNINDYSEVRGMLWECQSLLRARNFNLLGTTHATKIKTLDQILNPRERVLGSVAWGAGAEMVVSLDAKDPKDPTNPLRVASFCSHSGAPFQLELQFSKLGALELADPEQDLLDLFDKAVPIRPEGVSRADIQESGEKLLDGVSVRTIDRWINHALETGIIRKEGRTSSVRYFRIIPS